MYNFNYISVENVREFLNQENLRGCLHSHVRLVYQRRQLLRSKGLVM